LTANSSNFEISKSTNHHNSIIRNLEAFGLNFKRVLKISKTDEFKILKSKFYIWKLPSKGQVHLKNYDLVQRKGVTGPKHVFTVHVVEISNVNISRTSRSIWLENWSRYSCMVIKPFLLHFYTYSSFHVFPVLENAGQELELIFFLIFTWKSFLLPFYIGNMRDFHFWTGYTLLLYQVTIDEKMTLTFQKSIFKA